jgi:hypothetical protein
MSPKNVFIAHSLGGLIVKFSSSTPNPDLCSVNRCHDRFTTKTRYSDLAWQLRLNGDKLHHCKVPKTALPQWFRPECPPGEWSDSPDLKNQWKNPYKIFLTFGFRTERWDHQVAGPRQNSWHGYKEFALGHDGHDFDASRYNVSPDLKSKIQDQQVDHLRSWISDGTTNRNRTPYADSMTRHIRRNRFDPARGLYIQECPRKRTGRRLYRVSKPKHWEHRH